jgi:two-component sensor histidine kinase
MAGKPVYTRHHELGVLLGKAERDEMLRAIAVVPFSHEGHVIGCMNVASHTFEEVPVFACDALVTIAAQIGGVIVHLEAKEQLQASLREKELLLNEVHHRVKNNFQLISSLLDMSGMRVRNEEAIRLCTSVNSRVHSMALIHTQLYNSGDFNRVDMGASIRELVAHLAQIYAVDGRVITPAVDAAETYLPITHAVPCALALNEVISNSFKHAFSGRQKGRIETFFRKSDDGTVIIRVKDDGSGVSDDFDIEKVNTLGLKLARNLVQDQLNGKFQIKRNRGTEVTIEFRV